MDNCHIKKNSIKFAINEIQVKNGIIYYLTLVTIAIFRTAKKLQ